MTINFNNGVSFSLRITPNYMDVFRTKNGKAHATQRMGKTFFKWSEIADNYKQLAPHIEEIKALSLNAPRKAPDTVVKHQAR